MIPEDINLSEPKQELDAEPGLNYWGALGRRGRLELSMVSPELVRSFQGINYGLWAKGCYTNNRRCQEFYTETIYT